MTRTPHILWADDEIDLLKPHILFLQGKGYDVTGFTDGASLIEALEEDRLVDVVFLDENMPGLTGLETLQRIKAKRPHLPCVMITKSEEEHIMEEAIGSKMADYLIKPLNPNQILLSLKKILDEKRLVGEKAMSDYQREFRELGMRLMDRLGREDWEDIHKRLVHWDLELTASGDTGMSEVLRMQKQDAGRQFARFVTDRYGDWLADIDRCDGHEDPLLAPKVMAESVRPLLDEGKKTLMVVIDNFRYDQWRALGPMITEDWQVQSERMHWSFLPTATQYARNALFAGMTPSRIAQVHPQWWKDEQAKGSKNAHEAELLGAQLDRWGFSGQWGYHKITDVAAGRKLVEDFHQIRDRDFIAVVFNFVDMLSHARTESEIIKELAEDEAAYRSLTASWFEHSPLRELLRLAADAGFELVLTTDHGTVQVTDPVKVQGEKEVTDNPRYKTGRNLRHDGDVFAVSDPEAFGLPKAHLSSRYIFAMERGFMVYPNNLNRFVRYLDGTFQHGGISMEEMLVPLVHLVPR